MTLRNLVRRFRRRGSFGLDFSLIRLRGWSEKKERRHHSKCRTDVASPWIQVGARGFEPPTSSTPLKRATELRYAPTQAGVYHAASELANRMAQCPMPLCAALGRSTAQAGADEIGGAVEKCGSGHTPFSGRLDLVQGQKAAAGPDGDATVDFDHKARSSMAGDDAALP